MTENQFRWSATLVSAVISAGITYMLVHHLGFAALLALIAAVITYITFGLTVAFLDGSDW